MCATFQFRGKTYKPGSEVTGSGERGIVRHAWAGFAAAKSCLDIHESRLQGALNNRHRLQ